MAAAVHLYCKQCLERIKMARENKYYSRVAIFFKYDGILCHF